MPRPRSIPVLCSFFVATLTLSLATISRAPAAALFQTNDVVAFLGGSAVVATDQSGHLETALVLAHPGHRLRFRSLAFEGDTVFGQPRDLNYPGPAESLRRAGATVACVQFGALECLAGPEGLADFERASRLLLDALQGVTPRLILVLPPPFESKPPPLPDLGRRNADLARYLDVLRAHAATRTLPVIDLFGGFHRAGGPVDWTTDGRELNERGHRQVAAIWLENVGRPDLREEVAAAAFWNRPEIAELRRAVQGRSRLWFHFTRPMNWAFLHGDRTEQQASRDHLDRTRRWFPEEMEQYPALIAEVETRIESMVRQLPPSR